MKKTKLLTIGYKALQHQVLPHLPDHRPSGAHQVFSCLRAFALTGLAPWNISPLSLHRPGSFQTFRSQLEHYLLRKTFCDYPTFIRSSITGFFFFISSVSLTMYLVTHSCYCLPATLTYQLHESGNPVCLAPAGLAVSHSGPGTHRHTTNMCWMINNTRAQSTGISGVQPSLETERWTWENITQEPPEPHQRRNELKKNWPVLLGLSVHSFTW